MTIGPFSCVLFDLDGTLVDTVPDLTGAFNYVLEQNDLAPFSIERVRNTVGFGAYKTIERCFAHYGVEIGGEELERAHDQFMTYYSHNLCEKSTLYAGVCDVLVNLKASDVRMCVCTNKTQQLSVDILDQLGVLKYFDNICGSDTVKNKKPHPDHIFSAIRRVNMSSDGAILVGDSQADVNAAKAAHIPVIAMSYGYTATPSCELGADLVLDSFADIPKFLIGWNI